MLLSPAALMMCDALEDCASPGKVNYPLAATA
jgi:hypothetical protein